MNIPHAAIEPFEPLGIPALNRIILLLENAIGKALQDSFDMICLCNLDDDEAWVRETLIGEATELGATDVSVARQELKKNGKLIRLGYLVDYYTEGRDWPHMRLLFNKYDMKENS